MPIPLRVLILEDRAADAELAVEELRKAGFEPEWQRVETESAFAAGLTPELELIIADHSLPQYDSVRALERFKQSGLDIPFIIVSAKIGEELAVEQLKRGAADYVLKDRLARLGLAVARALEEKRLRAEERRAEQQIREREAWFRAILNKLYDGISVIDREGIIRFSTPSAARMSGYTIEEYVGTYALARLHPDDQVAAQRIFQDVVNRPGESVSGMYRNQNKDGSWRWLEFSATNLLGEAPVDGLIVNFRDVTERVAAEQRLRLQGAALEAAANAITITDHTGAIVWVNRAFSQMTGYAAAEVVGQNPRLLKSGRQAPEYYQGLWDTILAGNIWRGELINRRKDGSLYTDEMTITPVSANGNGITHFIAIKQNVTQRKETEKALQESHQRVRAILDGLSSFVGLLSLDGVILEVNRAPLEVAALSRDDVIGKPCAETYWYSHSPAVQAAARQAIARAAQGEIVRYDTAIRVAEGRTITIDLMFGPLRDAEGKIVQVLGSAVDITERKRTEEALLASEAKASAFSNAALDAIIMIDGEGAVIFWNPAAEAILGYSAGDILGRHLHDVLTPPRFKPEAEKGLAGFKQTGAGPIIGKVLELTALHRDGHEFPIELSVNKVRLGDQWCAVGILRDITERKRAEAALSERARLAALTAEVGISLTQVASLQGILQRCTEALVHHLGAAFARIWTLNEAGDTLELQASAGLYTHLDGAHARVPVGMYKIGLIAQERKPHLTNQVIGDPRVHHQDWARREGIVAFAGHPLLIGDKVCGVMAIFARQPLSEETLKCLAAVANEVALGIERKWSEESLRTLNAELEQRVCDRTAQLDAANKELEAFAYSVSHDLRAPLRGIDGFSQALLEDYGDKLDADGKSYLQRVRAASQRMAKLIDDILQLSRMTRSPMSRESVDLTAVAERVINDLRAGDRDRSVEVIIAPGLTANGDPRLLEVVMMNLLGNAWKFTGKTEHARIEFGATKHEGQPAFFLRDNGAGFDMAYAERLFGAFQRLHTETEFPGTGIGLATVQRIVRRHGGTVWAEGAVGRGATFYFTLGDHKEELP